MLFSLLSPLLLLSITFFDAKVEFVTLGGGKALASREGVCLRHGSETSFPETSVRAGRERTP
jgi:hypothetical protein